MDLLVDLEMDHWIRPRIKRGEDLGVTALAVRLGVHLVVYVGRERRKTIVAVGIRDELFPRQRLGVFQVHDRLIHWSITAGPPLAGEQAQRGPFLPAALG